MAEGSWCDFCKRDLRPTIPHTGAELTPLLECTTHGETLDGLFSLDDSIHDLLNDSKYATDVISCEMYVDISKRAIYTAGRAVNSNYKLPSPA